MNVVHKQGIEHIGDTVIQTSVLDYNQAFGDLSHLNNIFIVLIRKMFFSQFEDVFHSLLKLQVTLTH